MLEQNIKTLKDKLARTVKTEEDVLIVAATKTVSAEKINALKEYGIFDAGENRVQELLQKYDGVSGIRWHFIGTLQKNKVKYIVDKVCLIHSVDSKALAEEIHKRAGKIGKIIDVLAEVNIGREQTKSGIYEEQLQDLCDHIISLPHIRLRGIMSVMPAGAEESMYGRMKELFFEAKERYGESIDYLSMGMSNDYETAVRYGANIIRPGSAIFGARNFR